MNELLTNLLIAVITAAIPVLTTFIVKYISKARDKAIASTDNAKNEWYIQEIAAAISDAVSATSQTYVDALKKLARLILRRRNRLQQKPLTLALRLLARQQNRLLKKCTAMLLHICPQRLKRKSERRSLRLLLWKQ